MGLLDILLSWPAFWILILCLTGALIFIIVYFLVSLTDVESDLQNPIDMARRCNVWVLPEIALHCTLTALMLLSGSWFELLCLLPIAAYHVKQFLAHAHVFDATTIFGQLQFHKKVNFGKLGFYMLAFFFFLYRLVLALVEAASYRRASRYTGTV